MAPRRTPKQHRLSTLHTILVVLLVSTLASCGLITRNHLPDVSFATMAYLGTTEPGPDPFMDTIQNPQVNDLVDDTQSSGAHNGTITGTDPNIYGGTGKLAACDAELLATNLAANTALNTAFAKGIGIHPNDVKNYLATLKPLILLQDTWVTNHGFADGEPTPFQAVLQAGTGVLVDALGVPRVRCSCGNPLAEAWPGYTAPQTNPDAWQGYELDEVIRVNPAQEPAEELHINPLTDEEETTTEFSQAHREELTTIYQHADTAPKTTPADMGVTPDYELLQELGITPAQDSTTRPDGTTSISDADLEALKVEMLSMNIPSVCGLPAGQMENGGLWQSNYQGAWIGNGDYVKSRGETVDISAINAAAGDFDPDNPGDEIAVEITCILGAAPLPSSIGILDADLNFLALFEGLPSEAGRGRFPLAPFEVEDDALVIRYAARKEGDALCCASMTGVAKVRLLDGEPTVLDYELY